MKKLIVILLIGLVIRFLGFALISQLPQNGDLLRYADWGRIAFLKGYDQTYNKKAITFGGDSNNQPPGSIYPISLAYSGHLKTVNVINKLYPTSIEKSDVINLTVLYFFMRLPSFTAEIILTILLFIYVRKNKGLHPHLAASLLYLNPVLIYNSAFWGQMDAINNLFFIGAIMLLTSGKLVNSTIFLTLSTMIKLSILPLLPLYIVQFFKHHPSPKVIITSGVAVIGTVLLLTLPVSKKPIEWLAEYLKLSSGGELQSITSEAFNFWYVLFSFPLFSNTVPDEAALFLGTALSTYGYLLYIIFAVPLIIHVIRNRKNDPEKTFALLALLALISFIFLPKMHERYLFPFFPLLAVALGFSKKWLWFFVSISIIHFLNLFISWDPGYVPYIPYAVLENDWFKWGLGVALIGVFLILYYEILPIKKSANQKFQK